MQGFLGWTSFLTSFYSVQGSLHKKRNHFIQETDWELYFVSEQEILNQPQETAKIHRAPRYSLTDQEKVKSHRVPNTVWQTKNISFFVLVQRDWRFKMPHNCTWSLALMFCIVICMHVADWELPSYPVRCWEPSTSFLKDSWFLMLLTPPTSNWDPHYTANTHLTQSTLGFASSLPSGREDPAKDLVMLRTVLIHLPESVEHPTYSWSWRAGTACKKPASASAAHLNTPADITVGWRGNPRGKETDVRLTMLSWDKH